MKSYQHLNHQGVQSCVLSSSEILSLLASLDQRIYKPVYLNVDDVQFIGP